MKPDTPFSIFTAPKRDSRHWEAGTTTWAELAEMVKTPAKRKECGNYVLGTFAPTTVTHESGEVPCTALHRRKTAVVSRSALTLDVDHPGADFLDNFELLWPYAALTHTTWNSTADAPRYRLILPLDRVLHPDEYVAAAEAVMTRFGHESFDRGSSEAERYMFRPSAKTVKSYDYQILDGEPAPAADLLREFETDLSGKPMPAVHRNKRDPYSIEGVVGSFNTVYVDWDDLIEEYELPYEKVDDRRYQLVNAHSQAGMGPVAGADGLVYSHHANDPAYGRTCSAFDLVRLHRYGHLDDGSKDATPINRLPSHVAMLELASGDARVVRAQADVDFGAPLPPAGDDTGLGDLLDDDKAWQISLDRESKSNRVKDNIRNWDLLVQHDPLMATLRHNEMSASPEAMTHLPWRTIEREEDRILSDTDRWEITHYLERTYGLQATRMVIDAFVNTRARRQSFHPVKDYLDALEWDGRPRVEEALPGVDATPATRLIARKVFAAAVARVYDPGCKWDHTLVLFGKEGLGKSWWIDKMARGYSAPLGDITSKDTLLTMSRSWIIVSDEGHSLRKADQEAQKEFLTRTVDYVRRPYEKETQVYPRHNVIWSTTNDETFLRRQEGNRRFLVVECEDRVDFTALTDAYIDQVWAEAVALYRLGEPLFFDQEQAEVLADKRERFVEEDAVEGIIEEYLGQNVPTDWWNKSPVGRRQWLEDRADGFVPVGSERIDAVCSMQVWVEAMGRRQGDHKRYDLLQITEALRRLPGWSRAPTRRRMPGYGPQIAFVRDGTPGSTYSPHGKKTTDFDDPA